MVNYHKLCKILEQGNIETEIHEVLTWLKDKLDIDEKRKEYLKDLCENLNENLSRLLKKDEYTREEIGYILEDFMDYKLELYTSHCYHCGQDMSISSINGEDEVYGEACNFLNFYYHSYDSDFYDLPSTGRLHDLLMKMYLDINI